MLFSVTDIIWSSAAIFMLSFTIFAMNQVILLENRRIIFILWLAVTLCTCTYFMDISFPLVCATSSLLILLGVIVFIALLKLKHLYGHVQTKAQNVITAFKPWLNYHQEENSQRSIETIAEEISEVLNSEEPTKRKVDFVLKSLKEFKNKEHFQTSTPIQHKQDLFFVNASTSKNHNESDENNITDKDIKEWLKWYETHENESNIETQDTIRFRDNSTTPILNKTEIKQEDESTSYDQCLDEWIEWLKNEKDKMQLDLNNLKSNDELEYTRQSDLNVYTENLWEEWDKHRKEDNNITYVHDVDINLGKELIYCSYLSCEDNAESVLNDDMDTEDEREKLFSNYPDETSSSSSKSNEEETEDFESCHSNERYMF